MTNSERQHDPPGIFTALEANGVDYVTIGGLAVGAWGHPRATKDTDIVGEAQRDWWDPGDAGGGTGKPIGLRGLAAILEDAAAAHEVFHPRFAGGKAALLRRMELVAHKYFSQTLHHTAIGLPIEIVDHGKIPRVTGDPSEPVAFTTWWMYAQQLYLLHDLYDRPPDELDERVRFGLVQAFGVAQDDLKPFPRTPERHPESRLNAQPASRRNELPGPLSPPDQARTARGPHGSKATAAALLLVMVIEDLADSHRLLTKLG